MSPELIERLVQRTADLAIGPSTVRNQGASGVVSAARKALRRVDLRQYKNSKKLDFAKLLAEHTAIVRRQLPVGAKNWGTARKCLNIYLRDVLYNRFLSDHFDFVRFESCLEIPLDGHVARGLSQEEEGVELPRWRSIKLLSQLDSDQYQTVAKQVAKRLQTQSVHLDLMYWRRMRSKLTPYSR